MADYLKRFLGGAPSSVSSVISSEADDFADFATAASPAAPSHAASSAATAASSTHAAIGGGIFGPPGGLQGRPYTKWYRVWERVTLQDFYQELFIIPVLLVVLLINLWGSFANKSRAKQWAATHLPLLDSEFAVVGFGGGRRGAGVDDVGRQGLAKAMAGSMEVPEEMLRQKGKNEYITYASGRQNVAWLDVKLTLHKRYNPFLWFGEMILSFFFDSMPAPVERLEATAYCFDGKEKGLVPAQAQSPGGGAGSKDSSFDGFVWAVVHKDKMKQLRDDRYDLSLTATRDNAKLPDWATIMTESAEISDAMLTSELIKAVQECGEDLEALIVSDQPIDPPKKLNDTIPRKRVSISMKLNARPTSTALFQSFLRFPDHLVSTAHFRAEALRKVRATRDEEQRKIRKTDEEEKAEERRAAGDKMKKEERDRKLSKMGAEEQRKFLEREKEVERKKGMKKRTQRA